MSDLYNLAVNLPLRTPVVQRLGPALAAFPIGADLLAYPPPGGGLAVREAIAGWMRRVGGHTVVDPRRLVLTLGARHALALALDCTCRPGDTLLVDALTYHGMRALALGRHLHVVGVPMDEDGMQPDALEHLVSTTGARAVYVQPTLHNPTTTTMPLARRQAIAALADTRELTLIEGDVYSPLAWRDVEALPALAELAPDRCLHAGGIGKVLGPGLRVGWLLLPDDERHDRVAASVQLDTDGLPSLFPAIVAGWMADGTADALLGELVAAMAARARLAANLFGAELVTGPGLHAWLPSDDAVGIETRALARGVRVTPSRPLAADGQTARGVRLCLGAEEDPDRLEAALRIVAEVR